MLNDFSQVAAKCGITGPTLWRWVRDGVIPSPIVLDGLVRWSQPGLDTWAALGCPLGEPVDAKALTKLRLAWLREKRERLERERGVEDYLSEPEAN